MAGTESILGQYEASKSVTSQAGTDRIATDKDTFLKLLVAQLTHQDPLNPVEDKEFIAQLAQFTTVEELQNMNKSMSSLNTAYLKQQSVSAAGLIGKYVEAPGDMVTIANVGTDKGYSSYLNFNLPYDAGSMTMNVYAMDANGNPTTLVASRSLGSCKAGDGTVQWDGRDNNGNAMPDGVYSVNLVAKDVDGQSIYVTTSSSGRVIRVEMADDGNHKLVLQDLRSVRFNDVKIVDDPAIHEGSGSDTAAKDDDKQDDDTTAGTGGTTGGTGGTEGTTPGEGTEPGDGTTAGEGTEPGEGTA